MIEAHLLPAFGAKPIDDATTEVIEMRIAAFAGPARSRNKLLIQLGGILGRAKKVYGAGQPAFAIVPAECPVAKPPADRPRRLAS